MILEKPNNIIQKVNTIQDNRNSPNKSKKYLLVKDHRKIQIMILIQLLTILHQP
jgi:hypothetical protein